LLAQPAADPAAPPAAPAAPAAPAQRELSANQKAFLNLPEEKRKEFIKHFEECNRLFQAKRVFETLDEIEKARKIFKDVPELYNLEGSCYVEMRNFDKATEAFLEARKLSPNNPSVEFNLAEVLFVTARGENGKPPHWDKALAAMEAVLKLLPEGDVSLGRLVEFKIMLCKIKLGKTNEVTALAEKYDYLDESPFYYFAQAALSYEKSEAAKNEADKTAALMKAEEWLAMSARIFQNPAILAPWQDTLVEFGYIKSFFGGEEPGGAPAAPGAPAPAK
jgi:tetratricopeptide (TPR) repeat protein